MGQMKCCSARFRDLMMLKSASLKMLKTPTEHFPSSSNVSAEGIEPGAMTWCWGLSYAADTT